MKPLELFKIFGRIAVENDEANDNIDETSEKASSLANHLKTGLATAAKIGGAAISAAATGVVALTKASVAAFSEYEQLAGGAAKIFDEMSQTDILSDAQNAYRDLGMSANQYLSVMNNVGASFASTMGDEAGYEAAKTGLQAISDYASGTGKSVDDLSSKFALITRSTSSYQSIADQFSGILPATSADFLEQAQAAGILSESYKQLTDVPIDEYQAAVSQMLEIGVADLGLANNTAAEAMTTISGSLAMMKGAWQNLLVGLADDTQDFELLVGNVVDSVTTVAQNMIPRIATVLSGITNLIGSLAPVIISALPGLVSTVLPEFLTAVTSIVVAIAETLPDLFNSIVEVLPDALETVLSALPTLIPALIEGLVSMITTLCESLSDIIQPLIDSAPDIILSIVDALMTNLPALIQGAVSLVVALVAAMPQIMQALIDYLPTILTSIVNGLVAALPVLIAGVTTILTSVWNTITSIWTSIQEAVAPILENIKTAITEKFEAAKEAVATTIDTIKTNISDKFTAAKETVTGIFEEIKTSISEKIEAAKTTIGNAIDAIKGFFDFEFSWPHIPMPHFSISPAGWKFGDLFQGSIPSLGVEWYAKGGVMNDPTAFGINPNTGKVMVGGEARAEAIAPIDTLQSYVSAAVAGQNAVLVSVLEQILDAILAMDDNMGGNLRDALAGTRFSINDREFARLVKAVY